MDLRQGNVMQIERIINKHIYYEKWSDISLEEYEVKYKGESYLNTRWLVKQQIDQQMVNLYERQFGMLTIAEENKRKDSVNALGQDSRNESPQNDKNFKDKKISQKHHHYNLQLRTTLKQSSIIRPRLVCQIKNLNPERQNHFRLNINTVIKKQQNHYVYGDRVQKILSQIHNISQMIERNTQQIRNDRNINYNDKGGSQQEKKFKNSFFEERLVKKIQLSLGDHQKRKHQKQQKGTNLHNNNKQQQQEQKKRKLYIQMSELKQMQALKTRGVIIRIFLLVKWTDGTVSKVKMDYMNQYQPSMMLEYRQSRKRYWSDWKRKFKLQQPQKNDDQILQEIKYLQTPKTQFKSESQSNYETSTSSAVMEGKCRDQQKKSRQLQQLTKQKVRNMQKENGLNQQISRINKPILTIRQSSFASRKQQQSTNSIRKQTKLTLLEQFQQLNNNNREQQLDCNERQLNLKKWKDYIYRKEKIESNNYQAEKTRWLDHFKSDTTLKLKHQEQQKGIKDQQLLQNQHQTYKISQQKRKPHNHYYKICQQQYQKQKPTLVFKQKNILSYFNSTKSSVIIDKPQYIARKSINQQVLQQSRSRKLLKDYGIISQHRQYQQKQRQLSRQKVQNKSIERRQNKSIERRQNKSIERSDNRDYKIIKKSIIYDEQKQQLYDKRNLSGQQSRNYQIKERSLNIGRVLNSLKTKSESLMCKSSNDDNNLKNEGNYSVKRQSFISRDWISSEILKEKMAEYGRILDDRKSVINISDHKQDQKTTIGNNNQKTTFSNNNQKTTISNKKQKTAFINKKQKTAISKNNINSNKQLPKHIEIIEIDDD